jgi:Fe-S-cluster containining protein
MINHLAPDVINEIENVKNLDELYEITSKTTDNVKKSYPNIICKSGCNACCKTYGSPGTFAIEWERIKNFLDNSEQGYRDTIKNSLEEVKNQLRKTVAENPNTDMEKIVNNIQCPFLQNEVCSIYMIRPLICRMFGSFGSKPLPTQPDRMEVFTCEMEKDRWNEEIRNKTLKNLTLPDRDYFYNKLQELNGKEEAIFLINYIDNYFRENS